MAERAALRRQGEDDGIGLKNDYEEDDDLVEDKPGEGSSEPLLTSEMEEDDDMSEIAFDQAETEEQSHFSDNSTNLTTPPLEDDDTVDPDEADLENMMRLQEEAMLDLDSDDEDGGNVDANPNAPAAPVPAQQVQPQNAGEGRFEPQFEPLDPGFEQEEEMVSQTISLPTFATCAFYAIHNVHSLFFDYIDTTYTPTGHGISTCP